MKEIIGKKIKTTCDIHDHLKYLDFADNICLISHRHLEMRNIYYQCECNAVVPLSKAVGPKVTIDEPKRYASMKTNVVYLG